MEIDTEVLTKTYAEFTNKELLRRHASATLTDITCDITDSNCPI